MSPEGLLAVLLICTVHYRTSAETVVVNIPEMKFLGCFIDSGDRDLPLLARAGGMSLYKCLEACRCRGFAYCGIQVGSECWCGNSYGRHGEVGTSDCNHPCTEEASVSCGGHLRNSVYTTGITISTPGMKYIGCFADAPDRDLPLFAATEAMSPAKCYDTCKGKGFAYFGIQAGNACFCGNKYGKHGERPAAECNHRCNGHSAVFCGSIWRNSVYATGLTPPK